MDKKTKDLIEHLAKLKTKRTEEQKKQGIKLLPWKQQLLNQLDFERDAAAKGITIARVILTFNTAHIPFMIAGSREEIKMVMVWAEHLPYDMIICAYEGKYREFPQDSNEGKEYHETYEAGKVLNDPKSKDAVIIFGKEKQTKHRVWRVYERSGEGLELKMEAVNKDFDRVTGFLTFKG